MKTLEVTFPRSIVYRTASEAFKDAEYACAGTHYRNSIWRRIGRFLWGEA